MKSKCLESLKNVLRSNNKHKTKDINNNIVYIDVEIFSDETLNSFLDLSLSNFNQTPHFTFFTFDNEKFVNIFMSILVEGAVLYALSSQALIERGREFQILDNGMVFDPPALSELLQTQYQTNLVIHFEKLKLIKNTNINL